MPDDGVSVPLSLFGGMVTELSPTDVPEGLSPDCQDVAFLPGSVFQRPCLSKLFNAAFPSNPTMVYEKTYIQPNEEPLNLFLDSAAKLWREDVLNSPGTKTLISALPEKSGNVTCAQSITAFGREYIAFSDGRHGSHIPLQYDGTNLDRVTQDGPGASVGVVDSDNTGIAISSIVPYIPTSSTAVALYSGTLVSTGIVDFDGLKARYVQVGDKILISGSSSYNGTWTVLQKIGTNGIIFDSGLASPPTEFCNLDTGLYLLTTATPYGAEPASVTLAGVTDGSYDGTWPVRLEPSSDTILISLTPGLSSSSGGTLASAGQIDAGTHQVVCLFLTRQGYITKASPKTFWTAAGGKAATVGPIPLGPSNVVARILAFTGAGGSNFFYIPNDLVIPDPSGGLPTVISSTVVNDNTSTSAVVNFSDNALFAATAIDIPGRNYFSQGVLSDCIGFFPYASRLFAYGEWNKITNFLNMGFEGGYFILSTPAGWSVGTANGTLVNGGSWNSGMAWQITGSGAFDGLLIQSAFQDENGIAIIEPSTQYTFRCWANIATPSSGNIVAQFFSPSLGSLSIAEIPASSVSSSGGFLAAEFSSSTPSVIPSDIQLRIFSSGVTTVVTLDELQIIPTNDPYLDTQFQGSYVNAPEQFDNLTGILGDTSFAAAIRNCFNIRNVMYFNTAVGANSTTDNGTGEPSTWNVNDVSKSVGCVSIHGSDPGRTGSGESGEQWQFVISEGGLYVFAGGDSLKVSQEIQSPSANGFPGWNSINQNAIQTAWVKNDLINRRCYVGVPTGEATAPNVMFVLDYRELNDAYAIANNPPFRVSFSGKMIATDICRKWTRWSLSLNCGEEIARPDGTYQFCVGAGNGQTSGLANGFGNVYEFDANKLTDDDYGQVVPYYTTYYFPSPDQEQALGLDVHRKQADYLTMLMSGTGKTSITPLVNTLQNAFPQLAQYTLQANQNFDWEWDMWVTGERIALKIGSAPSTGSDNGFNLNTLALTMKKDSWGGVAGTINRF